MSWLNFNESLNSIKGQLSSFASGVLADGIIEDTDNDVTSTKNRIEDLETRGKAHSVEPKVLQSNNSENASWSWESPGKVPGEPPTSQRETFVSDLQKKVEILEFEKKELIVSLEQLDLDCQQTTDKLVTLKDNLQTSYNELKADFEKLQKEYGEVLTENMKKSIEINMLKGDTLKNPVEERITSLQEENRTLNSKLVDLQRDLENHEELLQKFEELKKNYDNNKDLSNEEREKNEEILNLYGELENDNARLRMKIQKCGETNEDNSDVFKDNAKLLQENTDLSRELQILKHENEKLINANEKFQNDQKLKNEDEKLKIALEKLKNNEEDLKNSREKLKNANEDLKQATNEKEKLTIIYENLKMSNEISKLEFEKVQRVSEELKKKQEQFKNKNDNLNSYNENLKIEFEKLQNHVEELRKECEEMSKKNEKLLEDHENFLIANEKLKNDLEKLQYSNKELKKQLKNAEDSSTPQNLIDHEEFSREKEALHEKYLGIITENMKKCIDSYSETTSKFSLISDEPQILEFAGKVETLLKLLLDFKCKTETLEKELCEVTQEKNKAIAEKNFEIEKLLKNSEILSQEVITKTQAIKDYEDECGELMKNNDLLISELQNYKNSSGLQTISESNEDNLLLLEAQLENANKRIQDMELVISDLENSKQDANLEMQTELEYIKKQLNMTGQELSCSKKEYQDLLQRYKHLEGEKRNFKASLDKIKIDYENTEYKYTEVNVSMETLKEENEDYKSKVVDLDSSSKKLEAVNFNLENKIELLQNVVDDFKQKLEVEMENTTQKELQIRGLIERLQNSKMCETGLKLQVDTIYKELQTVVETKHVLEIQYNQSQNRLQELQEELFKIKKDNIKALEPSTIDNKISSELQESDQETSTTSQLLQTQLENSQEENQIIRTECSKLKNDISQMTHQHLEFQQKILFLEGQLNDLSTSRNELVALITAKHQENIQYHGEIQRLNHFLVVETEKAQILESQLHNLKIETPVNSAVSSEELLQKNEEICLKNDEIEKLTDQNNFLREKCEVLAQNLLQEQSNVQKVLSERLSASDKEQSLAKELERLRAHLVEIEEMYTQELLQAEQKNKEMQTKMHEIEQREKDSSSIYTSVSIRANQQVETLQTQLQLVTNQRDDLRVKVSDLEDDHNKQFAALTNLQLVLEQFQKEKDKDVYQETERVRRQIGVERQVQNELHGDISSLKLQLEESKQGLQAASRLTDQLEKCKQQIVNFKDEVSMLQDQLKSSEAKYKALSTQSDLKVDKILIKNLIIGYITSHSTDQNQILKIIATVLDFNQKESDKVNLNTPQHAGWLSSILHPQSLNSSPSMMQQSLSEAFVRFLENESKPKVLPNLLIPNQVKETEPSASSSNTTPRQSPSPLVLSEVLLPTFVDFAKSRNSSSILKDVLKDNS